MTAADVHRPWISDHRFRDYRLGCVKRNEKRETVASTADSWLPGVLLIAGYQGMRLTCFLLVAVHTAGQPRAM